VLIFRIRSLSFPELVLNQHLLVGAITLDSSFKLTYGSPQSLWQVASQFDPRQSIVTRLYQQGKLAIICQVRHSSQERVASLSFLGGSGDLQAEDLAIILDDMRQCTQSLGAMHLVSEVDHKQPILESMKSWGFMVSAWQDIWRLERQASHPDPLERRAEWCPLAEVDWWQAAQLLQSVIPPISQATDLPLRYRSRFWVCHQSEHIIAFADVRHGPQGIWIQPTFEPGASHVDDLVVDLLNSLPVRLSRPLYLSIRSYQSWLFRSIEMMNAEYLGHQAILVKHLAGHIKGISPVELLQLEKAKVKPSHPVVTSQSTIRIMH
jgi:hypothetical protein